MVTVGFQGTVDESAWSNYMWRANEIAFRHGVWSGGDVSVGVGTRAVDISPIDCIIAGIWHTTTAVTTLTIGANTDAQSRARIDLIVAEANWTLKNVTLKPLPGTPATNPVPVNPTQTVGGLWQMPLARVRVPAGATGILTANTEPCKPLPRKPIVYRLNPQIETVSGGATNWRGLGVIDLVDPGWSYRVDLGASVRFNATETSGYMRIRVASVDGASVYGEGVSASTKAVAAGVGKAPAVIGGQITSALNGTRRFQLETFPAEYSASEQIQVLDHPSNHYTLVLRPA